MEPILTEQDIINTYSAREQFSCKKYSEYLKLIEENPSMGYKKAAKLLGVKQGMARWWHTKGDKKAIPLPLKAVQKLNSAGMLPFYESHKDCKIVLNMLGVLFGDGGIDVRLNTVAFISSDKKDVDLWHLDLLRVFPFAEGKTQIVEGGEYGHSFNIRCYDRAVVRFFAALGAPVGNKVTAAYLLPQWISKASEKSSIAFLDGYLASEVSVVRWRPDSRGNNRFTDLSIGVSKIEFLEDEHRGFLRGVEALLKSVGVQTTGNIYKNYSGGRHRKDGAFTANYRIFLRTTFHHVISCNEKFSLRYAQDKKERFNEVIKRATVEKTL
ncbi:MAG: hypothetical protein V1494_06510 [Candidatus Diapherotrites archaeon]